MKSTRVWTANNMRDTVVDPKQLVSISTQNTNREIPNQIAEDVISEDKKTFSFGRNSQKYTEQIDEKELPELRDSQKSPEQKLQEQREAADRYLAK